MSEPNLPFPITTWKEDDRPREKLLNKGKNALSDAELVAILIGSGSRQESAVNLAKRILIDSENSLGKLAKKSIAQLKQFKGVGKAKAISIIAALELGRRRRYQEANKEAKISSSVTVFELIQPKIGELMHEEFWVIYLNNSNTVLQTVQLSKGGITGTVVDIRLALRKAIELGAVAIVLAHNHPSGTLKPSQPDIDLTKKIKAAGESLDIKVLDHLIITENAYFSFADEQIL